MLVDLFCDGMQHTQKLNVQICIVWDIGIFAIHIDNRFCMRCKDIHSFISFIHPFIIFSRVPYHPTKEGTLVLAGEANLTSTPGDGKFGFAS